jgi:hypothetical protein
MKIMSSTKPLLSFPFFLASAICIAHSSHSLDALYITQKRAEIVIDGGREGQEVTKGGGLAFPKTFRVSRDVDRAGQKAFFPDLVNQEDLHQSTGKKVVDWFSSILESIKTLKSKHGSILVSPKPISTLLLLCK